MTPAHARLAAKGASPERWMLFLHGILGRGANWRHIARRFVHARPRWGAVLVDLREHGDSRGFPPPHTVESAARDLAAIGPAHGVLGHSFGGKVALSYLAETPSLEQAWIVDANPGFRPGARTDTLRVIELLEALGPAHPSRESFAERVVQAGQARAVGDWLAMNLVREDGGFRFAFDLAAIRALLDDYFARDLWWVLERVRPRAHLVVAERSPVFSDEDRRRAERCATVHPMATGHWVHQEDPEGMLRLLLDQIPA